MLVDLLEKAEETRRFYQSLRLPLPDALRRLIGSNSSSESVGVSGGFKLPTMPPEAADDWTWIPLAESSPGTLVRALLRVARAPLKSKELYEQINAMGISASLGTVSNAAVRLETQEIIIRDVSGGWLIAKP